MKKYLLLLLIMISTQATFSQSKFSNGFRNGYKEGYCHNQGIGCLPPNPPIAPIPNVNESINSYQDGYNKGFEQGLSAQKNNSNNTQTRERYKTAEPRFVDNFTYQPNYDLMLKVLQYKQQQALQNSEKQNYSEKNYEKNLEKAQDILDWIALIKSIDLGNEYSSIIVTLNRYEKEIQSIEYKYQIANNTQYFDEVGRYVDEVRLFIQTNENKKIIEESYQLYLGQNYDKAITTVLPLVKKIERRAIKDKNQIFVIYFLLAQSYYHYNNFSQAEEFATKAIDNAITKEIGDLYFLRSMARTNIQLYQSSNTDLDYLINNYNQINYTTNNLATLYNNKANNFVRLKKYNDAKPLIEKALSLNQNIDYIWDTKGELEYHLGNYSESIKAMTNALKLNESGNPYYYRGLANIKLGNKADACKDFSKAVELGETKAIYEIRKNCN